MIAKLTTYGYCSRFESISAAVVSIHVKFDECTSTTRARCPGSHHRDFPRTRRTMNAFRVSWYHRTRYTETVLSTSQIVKLREHHLRPTRRSHNAILRRPHQRLDMVSVVDGRGGKVGLIYSGMILIEHSPDLDKSSDATVAISQCAQAVS